METGWITALKLGRKGERKVDDPATKKWPHFIAPDLTSESSVQPDRDRRRISAAAKSASALSTHSRVICFMQHDPLRRNITKK
jgi:hypothetical protein